MEALKSMEGEQGFMIINIWLSREIAGGLSRVFMLPPPHGEQ
jgi:hypothetical protein